MLLGVPMEVGLPQCAPGCAGLLCVRIFRKDRHHMTYCASFSSVPISRYLVAAAIPVSAGLAIYFLCQDIKPTSVFAGASSANNFWLFFFLTPLGALGEEIGWRGYLHKRLELEGFRGIVSSLMVGILWTGIHIPMFLHGGSALYSALYGALVTSLAIVLYAVVQDSDFSVAIATVFHMTLNWTNFLYVDRIYMVQVMKIIAMVWVTVAMACILAQPSLYLLAPPLPNEALSGASAAASRDKA